MRRGGAIGERRREAGGQRQQRIRLTRELQRPAHAVFNYCH